MKNIKQVVAGALIATAAGGALAAPLVADAGMSVTLTGEASMTVPNDEAFITFTAEEVAAKAPIAMDVVTKRGNAAQAALKPFGDKITVETADFSTWPVYTRAKEGEVASIGAWGARQTVRVTVKDVKSVSDVMQAAAEHMNYDGITFRISEGAQKAQKEVLLAAAIDDALRQAGVIAEKLGLAAENVRIEKLAVHGRSGGQVRYYAAPMMKANALESARAAAPAVSAGTSDVSLSVGVDVRIRP